jgi:hypothetical protein
MQEEVHEAPSGDLSNEQVLRFANQRTHTPQCRANRAVHEQASQERAECLEIAAQLMCYEIIGLMVMIAFEMAP